MKSLRSWKMAASSGWAGILGILVLLFTLVLVDGSEYLREVSRPAAEFRHHEVTRPFMQQKDNKVKRDVNTVTQDGHLEELTVGFKAFGSDYLLDLHMNKYLFPSNFVEKHDKGGVVIKNKPYETNNNHCYYHGKVQGISNSWAAISTCQSISGVVFNGMDMLYLEPTRDDNLVFVYQKQDLLPQNYSCGFDGSSIPSDFQKHAKFRHRRASDIRGPYNSNKLSRYVELVLVNDLKEYKEMKENKDTVIARSKEIANIVNALYSPLNIFIALVGVVIWSEFDQITLSKDGDATLTNFLHYRRERLVSEVPNDNAQLITGITFEGGVVGKALKGPICTYEYSGGVNMDHSPVVALVATTVAHELGHNFGMEHDNDDCSCPDDRCIMAPSSSSTSPTHWSSCSLEYLDTAFKHGMDYCLRNRPTRLLGPVCGNGFVESGEQCDCGLKNFCNNPCCNASSCMLFTNATCATGECCDLTTCQVKSPGLLCRRAETECDLPEFCDGIREYCPNDVFKQDGVSCKHNKAYCYRGSCRSHSDQCKLLWGGSGQMSDYRCFDQNKKGTASGNCGYYRLNQTYKPCEKEDILCGMLHCTHLNERLEFGMESVAILSRSFITTGGKILTCRSAIVDLGLNSIDPGLAPDGAKCGENKVCVNQRCMPVAALRRNTCPYDCNGRGVCNSRGNCHCEIGFAPPFCDGPGSGGSEDSGPPSDPHAYSHIATILYILFLGIVPCTAVIACVAYYYRRHLRMWWVQKARETAIRSRAKEAAQRKKQTRYCVDRNSLRNIEISCPIQPELMASNVPLKSECSSTASTPSVPAQSRPPSSHSTISRSQSIKAAKLNLDRNSLRNLEISHPVLQAENTSARIMPVRPAPPRPTSPSARNSIMRTPSWSSSSATATRPATVVRAFSIQEGSRPGSTISARSKRLSGPSLRPTNPPPRPPPPKTSLKDSAYSEINDGLPAYSDLFYDDCQNTISLDKVQQPASNDVGDSATTEANKRIYATVGNNPKKPQSTARNHVPASSNSSGINGNKVKENRDVGVHRYDTNERTSTASTPSVPTSGVVATLTRRDMNGISPTSLVASLAKRFEQQPSSTQANNSSTKSGGSFRQTKPQLAPKPAATQFQK